MYAMFAFSECYDICVQYACMNKFFINNYECVYCSIRSSSSGLYLNQLHVEC